MKLTREATITKNTQKEDEKEDEMRKNKIKTRWHRCINRQTDKQIRTAREEPPWPILLHVDVSKTAGWMTDSADPDQILHNIWSGSKLFV